MTDFYGSLYYSDQEIDELKGRREPREDALARIVESVHAVRIADGHCASPNEGALYAYPDHHEGDERWFVTYEARLREFATTGIIESVIMPSWWTPEQREAVLHPDGSICTNENPEHRSFFCVGKRITADLETGAEVPA